MKQEPSSHSRPNTLAKKYKQKNCWGILASLDLHGCHPEYIRKPVLIRKFVAALCDSINMKRYGPTMVKRFGEGELEGYSALQFIETSSVTIHFDEGKDRAFIEVFSCKYFDPKEALAFCKGYLQAKKAKSRHFLRY